MEDREQLAANPGDTELDPVQLLRQRAQARLPGRFSGGAELIEDLSPQAMREALHELRLNQIELEMQNDELRRTRLELDAQRDRYFDLYELAPVGYCTLSEQGLILSANLSAAKLLATERNALLGQRFSRFVCREQQDRYYLYVKQLLQKQEPQVCELQMQTLQGQVFWVHLAAVALPAQDAGQVLRVTVSDISERKQVSRELIEAIHAREDAKVANYAKTQFLANISHEFRTPMNGVMGMAQLLQLPGLTEAERIDYAGVVLSSGQALMNLLNDVLDITRMEAGKLELESVRIVPAQIVGAVEAVFSQSARGKGLALESAWIGPELSYRSDPQRLTQMLSNLVNNAIKFTAQGSVRIEAREVACTAQTATLEFAVSDTGIGIDPRQQALLFQSFFQVDSSNTRSYDGAGLGLSMVRKLAELMGGEVGVQSQLGQGSRFWFRIQAQGLGPTD